MTIRLTLICHARTEAQRAGRFPDDEPIDDERAANAKGVAGKVARADQVWCGPELRARQTAEVLGLAATVEPALRDCEYNRWAGRRLTTVEAEEPDGLAAWLTDPHAAPHGGEALTDVLARVGRWLEGQSVEAGHVIAVTHAAVIRAAVINTLKAHPGASYRMDVEPLSLTVLTYAGCWRVRSMGTPHVG